MYGYEQENVRIPEVQNIAIPSLAYAYGSAHVAARHCGMEQPPYPPRGIWQHGWIREHTFLHPALVVWDDGTHSKEDFHWVNRKDVELYLRSHGYSNVHAVGLGIAYLPPIDIPRMPNSLLVMPVHSLYTTEHDWDFKRYVDEIKAIKDDFDYVAACIHPACIGKGYWAKDFEDAGIEVLPGSKFYGGTSLERMQWLLSRFEYVTTNSAGTQLAYAPAFGAKVSISGTYIPTAKKEVEDNNLFHAYPEMLDIFIEVNSEKWMKDHYGFLFQEHPKDAKDMTEWGRHQIGMDDIKSPDELRDLFGWPGRKPDSYFSQLSADDIDTLANKESQPDSSRSSTFDLFEAMDRANKGSLNDCLMLALGFKCKIWRDDYESDAEVAYWYQEAAKMGCVEAQMALTKLRLESEALHSSEEVAALVSLLRKSNDAQVQLFCDQVEQRMSA